MNFDSQGRLVVAELLHLFLQREGVPEAHSFVNKEVVPRAMESGEDLSQVLERLVGNHPLITEEMWQRLGESGIFSYLRSPEMYLGDAEEIAIRESRNTF
jgi:hypothetical protein